MKDDPFERAVQREHELRESLSTTDDLRPREGLRRGDWLALIPFAVLGLIGALTETWYLLPTIAVGVGLAVHLYVYRATSTSTLPHGLRLGLALLAGLFTMFFVWGVTFSILGPSSSTSVSGLVPG